MLLQVVSVAASLQGGLHNLPITSTPGLNMDRSLARPGIPLSSSSPMMMPGHQPGILSRPGFPPQGAPFGLPNMRPGFPMPGQGMRPPFQEMEEPKEWPSDDKLEEEALAEMEDEDTDHRMDLPGGPSPLMSLPMMGMRMRMPGPGGPPRMPMQLTGGSPRPGMMMELGQPVSSPGMQLGPGGMMGRPGLLGQRVMQPGTPHEVSEGMIRPQMPQGLMGQAAMGMRLGMGGQGPRGLSPGNLSLGQRLGMHGNPGMRGMGPGQGPIRIVLGQRPNLVRPGGPFSMDNPRLQLGDVPSSQADRGSLEEGPSGVPGSNPNPNNGPQGPGLLPGLMMGAALRGGRPGLLGARPNMPVNGGFRFGPGALNFRGPRPDFMHGPGMDKQLVEGAQGGLPTPFNAGPQDGKSPEYGEADNSPEYGAGFSETGNGNSAQDTDLRGNTDLRTDTDLRPQDMDLRSSNTGAGIGSDLSKSRRLSRWSSADGESANSAAAQDGQAETNGPTTTTNIFPAASQDKSSAASNANQTAPDALEGAPEV